MELDEAIAGRRSVRSYSAASVDDAVVRLVINAAIQAPSARNEQPWVFTVLRDQETLLRLSTEEKAHLLASVATGQESEEARAQLLDAHFHIFYHAPVLLPVSACRRMPWMVEDCALASQNLMLKAHALGIGSCWIGLAQNFLNTPEGKEGVGLLAEEFAVAPIILGYPKGPTPPVPRRTSIIMARLKYVPPAMATRTAMVKVGDGRLPVRGRRPRLQSIKPPWPPQLSRLAF